VVPKIAVVAAGVFKSSHNPRGKAASLSTRNELKPASLPTVSSQDMHSGGIWGLTWGLGSGVI
jgi:hypothetical protein